MSNSDLTASNPFNTLSTNETAYVAKPSVGTCDKKYTKFADSETNVISKTATSFFSDGREEVDAYQGLHEGTGMRQYEGPCDHEQFVQPHLEHDPRVVSERDHVRSNPFLKVTSTVMPPTETSTLERTEVATVHSESPVDVFSAAPFRRNQQKRSAFQKQSRGPVKAQLPFTTAPESCSTKSSERSDFGKSTASEQTARMNHNLHINPQTSDASIGSRPGDRLVCKAEIGFSIQNDFGSSFALPKPYVMAEPRNLLTLNAQKPKSNPGLPTPFVSAHTKVEAPVINSSPASADPEVSLPVLGGTELEEYADEPLLRSGMHQATWIGGTKGLGGEGKSRKKHTAGEETSSIIEDRDRFEKGPINAPLSYEANYGSLKSSKNRKKPNTDNLPAEFANLGFSEEDPDAVVARDVQSVSQHVSGGDHPINSVNERTNVDAFFQTEGGSHTLPRTGTKKQRLVPTSVSMEPVGFKTKSTLV